MNRNAREVLDQAGPAITAAGKIRYLKPEEFEDITDDELGALSRKLRSLSFSCLEGARLVEKIARARHVEPVFDQEFGLCMDPCEHPSINGGICAACNETVS